GGKTLGRGTGFPRHGGAAAVAALVAGPEADATRVSEFFKGNGGFGQAQLFALIEAGRAAHGEHQGSALAGEIVGGEAVGRPARHVANDVVVGKAPAGPAFAAGKKALEF